MKPLTHEELDWLNDPDRPDAMPPGCPGVLEPGTCRLEPIAPGRLLLIRTLHCGVCGATIETGPNYGPVPAERN